MLFAPKNVLMFYTTIMKSFQQKWDAEFDSSIVDPPNPPELVQGYYAFTFHLFGQFTGVESLLMKCF